MLDLCKILQFSASVAYALQHFSISITFLLSGQPWLQTVAYKHAQPQVSRAHLAKWLQVNSGASSWGQS